MQLMWFYSQSLLFVLLLCGTRTTFSCHTPLGYPGKLVPMPQCTQMLQLLQRYRDTNLPTRVRTFLQLSHSHVHNGQDFVCCGEVINLNETDGTAILRNFESECGDNVRKRISFGTETLLMRYPWSVLLIYDSLEQFQCGGTLVTHRYVLTAAHCVTNIFWELIGVRLGEHNIRTNPDCEEDLFGELHCSSPVQDVVIDYVISHPNYSKFTHNNDIALIRFKQHITFIRSIRPICLPSFQRTFEEHNRGIISGWGATDNGTSSDVLMEARVPIHSIAHCQGIYRRKEFDWQYKICASGTYGIQTCKGDSGGPLFLALEEDADRNSGKFRFMQVGVISMGTTVCGRDGHNSNLPSIFTNVAAYMDWVMQNLEM